MCLCKYDNTGRLISLLSCQILLGERAHLIEFPSILLLPGATTGSIVNIAVHQNHALEEQKWESECWSLQEDILQEYGQSSPESPELSGCNYETVKC